MHFRLRLVALALAAFPSASASAQHDLFTLPIADPAYRQLDGLQRTGCVAARVSPYRPYLVSGIRRALVAAVRDETCRGAILDALVRRFRPDTTSPPPIPEPGALPPVGPVMLEDIADQPEEEDPTGLGVGAEGGVRLTSLSRGVVRPLWLDARPTAEGDPSAVGFARLRVTWDGGDRIAAVAEATAQTHAKNDPLVRARAFRETSGVFDFTEAYVNARLGRVILSFGRAREAWLGEGEESTVLSAHGPPLDRFLATARWSRLEIRAIFASIDDVKLTVEEDSLVPGTPVQRLHRMLAGHAFTIRPTRGWELTLGETALLSRRGGGVDLAFANPLMLYLVTEHDTSYAGGSASGNNLMVFGSTRLQRGRLTGEAELVVDDIQIDAADRAVIPHQLAWRVSGTMGITSPWPASLGVEYRRADSYAYLRRFYSEVYHQFDRPLGTELGPDANMLRASAEVWPTGRVRFAGGVGRWNRGALRLTQRPAQAAFGHAGEPYPSVSEERPAVQEAWLGDATVEWLDTSLPVRLTVELARIDNVNNQLGESGNFLRAHLVASYRFRYP
ncbi:MAG TPA: capsule assembly Wzi family protein [Gemmatimonadaceae bacterium]|nr:capsule assembly Wzi family protein [Gemmatimonadaceae bacterium]